MADQTTDRQRLAEAGIDPEALRQAAFRDSHSWSVVHRPQGQGAFTFRLESARDSFESLLASLAELPTEGRTGPDPLLEIRENPRLFRAVLAESWSIRRKLQRLPRVLLPHGEEEPRTATVACGYLLATHSVWDAAAIRIYVQTAQQSDPLLLEELWTLPTLLKFILLEMSLEQAKARLLAPDSAEAGTAELLTARIKSMREIGYADWFSVMEPLVPFDPMLQQDPAMAYSRMDFDSRETYRKRVAIIARYSDSSELQVAAAALALADEARQRHIDDPRLYLRHIHIGYYLFEDGFEQLRQRIGYRPRFIDRLRRFIARNSDDFYIGGIEVITVLLIAAILLPLIPNYSIFGGITVAFILLLLPVTQGAVDLVNNTITAVFKARALPKLDFSEGIPAEYASLVAIPTLLINEAQVRELVQELEVRFLANQDPNLHFALITDLPDSVSRPRENDTDPMVELAKRLIEELNRQYVKPEKHGTFLLLHRHRIFNAQQGVWMGWERKRGKLLDLNKLLKGEFDAFPVKAGRLDILHQIRYVITLDSDTQLPRGTANSLVGAMAHPLNRAIVDPHRRIVTQGYGILQPRVGVSVQSASRSRLASIYSGQTGFDIYTRAISDAYQDLYGEGIFTGKGIYEVQALHAVLDRRFPRNSLLSHDLIEGAYARVGLATDIELIDDYPSHYSAYTRRKHRWVRGDWQIAQWLFSRVPDESGHRVRNPISTISRWKIFDNLRRSLVEPVTLILLVAGWLGLPGGALYWTLVTIFLLFVPTLVQLAFSLGRAIVTEQPGSVRESILGFFQAIFITLLNLAFLPHQTLLAIDAIVRSLVRRFITGQRLLEWETAAEAESATRRTTPVDRYLALSPLFAVAIAVLLAIFRSRSLFVAAPILVLWGFESGITEWLNKPAREDQPAIRAEDNRFLREQVLRVWRFFYEFGGESHNFLIPDNVEEEGLFEAARVSPTNLGLLFNARQAACELGFLTVPEYVELMRSSYRTMDKLPKHRGHLYNWYDTRSLQPLLPITVSSVDSGNLIASLYTVRTGTRTMLSRPLLEDRLFLGLATHFDLLQRLEHAPNTLRVLQPPSRDAKQEDWLKWVLASPYDELHSAPGYTRDSPNEFAWWAKETRARQHAIRHLVEQFLPWLQPPYEPLRSHGHLGPAFKNANPTLEELPGFIESLEQRVARISKSGTELSEVAERLRRELPQARDRALALQESVREVSLEANRLAENMEFGFLVDKGRQLLSIGYEVSTGKLHRACYDMLASEARIATFIAVARGELAQQGWFKMSRTHTMAYGRSVLLSWTGTMFEYLMPGLWMRSYPETLIAKSMCNAVEIHRAFARERNIPWGISESGYGQKDDAGHYHYQAFGIPQISLKWDATAGPVISPYSTFLALGVLPAEAIRNLRKMAALKWIGAYGFYESADYTSGEGQPRIVREWMAHHQGMSILAALNLLEDRVVQKWFHANAQMQSVELLLHEKPMREAAMRAEMRQFSGKQPRASSRKKAS